MFGGWVVSAGYANIGDILAQEFPVDINTTLAMVGWASVRAR